MAALTIGKVARSAGMAIDTVRYYEHEGLLEKPTRSAAGYRQYPPEAVSRLRFIRQAKDLGFSLKEIKELLSLRATPGKSSGEVKARAERKIADIEQRIAALRRMKRALTQITAACAGCGPVSECPILEALESREST